MIKRSGVEVMNARSKNSTLAKEQTEILKQGYYTSLSGKQVDIATAQEAAVKGTQYYRDYAVRLPDDPDVMPFDNISLKQGNPITPVIEVTNETTAQAAVRLLGLGKTNLVALNFAAARNVGGGFLAGAMAQEEDLCRCSGLYPCLKSKPLFYNANIISEDSLYTDGVLYSPKVPFIRNEHLLFLEEPFELSIITAPAPNVTALKKSSSEKEEDDMDHIVYVTIQERATKVLQIAEMHGHKNIILGAWGCGAFGNDPGQVAIAFTEALKKVPYFEHVCFGIYDTREPPILYETFKEVFT